MVYALLGLTSCQARSSIIIDYSNRVSDAIILTTLSMHSLQSSLAPLLYAAEFNAHDCPSWVPNWLSLDDEIAIRRLEKKIDQYKGALLDPTRLCFEPPVSQLLFHSPPPTLSIFVYPPDIIRHTFRTIEWRNLLPRSLYSKYREWRGFMSLFKLEAVRNWDKDLWTQDLLIEYDTFLRYLLRATPKLKKVAPKASLRPEPMMESMERSSHPGEWSRFSVFFTPPTMFFTQHRRFGYEDHDLQKGDAILSIVGGITPLMVRSVADNAWQIIGSTKTSFEIMVTHDGSLDWSRNERRQWVTIL